MGGGILVERGQEDTYGTLTYRYGRGSTELVFEVGKGGRRERKYRVGVG